MQWLTLIAYRLHAVGREVGEGFFDCVCDFDFRISVLFTMLAHWVGPFIGAGIMPEIYPPVSRRIYPPLADLSARFKADLTGAVSIGVAVHSLAHLVDRRSKYMVPILKRTTDNQPLTNDHLQRTTDLLATGVSVFSLGILGTTRQPLLK